VPAGGLFTDKPDNAGNYPVGEPARQQMGKIKFNAKSKTEVEKTLLHIKNMVCPRCISTVTRVLQESGLSVEEVRLGEARIQGEATPDYDRLNAALKTEGFEVIYDREKQLSESIKNILIDYLDHYQTQYEPVTTSVFLSEKLNLPYQHLSKIFSRQENITIEKYFIKLKIEKVKELLSYNQLTLSQIAYQLKYSSVQHLSNQFKKVTGISVSDYKQDPASTRTSLDALT
jgi:AraC family transcriptional regulator